MNKNDKRDFFFTCITSILLYMLHICYIIYIIIYIFAIIYFIIYYYINTRFIAVSNYIEKKNITNFIVLQIFILSK